MNDRSDSAERVHFLGAVTVAIEQGRGAATVMRYGDELDVTAALREANADRHGRCALLELADDETEQVRRWGAVYVRRGPWPEGMSRIEPGSIEWLQAREEARKAAWNEPDGASRAAALSAVTDRFGPAPRTSTTLAELR